MEWMGGWLKSVILVILIATFVDLLLPSQAMQRYVKTVVSLFLLLTLLQPLLTLVRPGASFDALLSGAMAQLEGTARQGSAGTQGLASLDAIRSRADAIRRQQQSQALQLAERQTEAAIRRSLEERGDMTVAAVRVTLSAPDGGPPVIRAVALRVRAGAPRTKAAQVQAAGERMPPIRPIEPIAPVTIGGGKDEGASVPVSAGVGKARKEPTATERQLRTSVEARLAETWQLKPQQLELEIQSEAGGEPH